MENIFLLTSTSSFVNLMFGAKSFSTFVIILPRVLGCLTSIRILFQN